MDKKDKKKKKKKKFDTSDYFFYGAVFVIALFFGYVVWSGSRGAGGDYATTTTTIKPSYGFCSDPRPEVCMTLYEPVCGDNSVTYANSCVACANPDVITWTSGECIRRLAVYYRSGCFNETDGAASTC